MRHAKRRQCTFLRVHSRVEKHSDALEAVGAPKHTTDLLNALRVPERKTITVKRRPLSVHVELHCGDKPFQRDKS
jgi:hypothetical protein